MAGEGHASYAKVGLTVVLGVAAVAGLLIYFGGAGRDTCVFQAETYYDDPVSGLSVGSEVNFRGVKVGEVREISFIGCHYEDVDEPDRQKIYIRMAFDSKLARLDTSEDPEELLRSLVSKGLRATVSASGVTGLSRMELNMPKDGSAQPVPPVSWRPELVCIPPAPSVLQSFSDAATQVMNKMKQMDFSSAWSNVSSVAESFSEISRNMSGLVEGQKAGIDSILLSVDQAARSLKEFADAVRENPSLLLRPRDPDPLPETSR